jgi:hypothetical protein
MTHRSRIADIIHHASQLSGVSVELILGPARREPVVRVRHAICVIAREQTIRHGDLIQRAYSYPMMAHALKRHDHSTIISACKRAQGLIEHDPAYAAFVDELRAVVDGSKPFVGIEKAMPVVFEVPPRAKSVKAIICDKSDAPDSAHRFHDEIGRSTSKLGDALLKAMAA